MRNAGSDTVACAISVAPLPRWIAAGSVDILEPAAFRSEATLADLTFLTTVADLPRTLWRYRLALLAAERCVGSAERHDGMSALRDALSLTPRGRSTGVEELQDFLE